jgi:hypothetical protein
MTRNRDLKRYYLILLAGWLMAAFYFLFVTFPLIGERQVQVRELAEKRQRLLEAGHGMNSEEVRGRIEALRAEIEAFSKIEQDQARGIRFPAEVQTMLDRPFQLLEFDHRKFIILERIRGLLQANEVTVLEDWERRFPVPVGESPYLLWAQLTVMDQLIRTVIEVGVERIDELRLIPVKPATDSSVATGTELGVSVQMRLTGPMEAIHTLIMMLPLNGDELSEIGMKASDDPKSSFFISRFILKKSSAAAFDEVSFEFVARAFLKKETADW